MYTSVGYYSRYDNVIGYLDARAGLRMLEVARTTGDVYVKAGLVRDSHKDYYNNVIEWGAGARVTPPAAVSSGISPPAEKSAIIISASSPLSR